MQKRSVLWVGLCLVCVGAALHAEEIFGHVVKVYDGDTIAIVREGTMEEVCVRLQAIDAPEREQPGYREAQVFLAKLLHGGRIRAEVHKLDQYDRTVARVFFGDLDVEYVLIRSGMAWHYPYFNQEKHLAEAQKSAQRERIGIWQDPAPINPYEWRKARRKSSVPPP